MTTALIVLIVAYPLALLVAVALCRAAADGDRLADRAREARDRGRPRWDGWRI